MKSFLWLFALWAVLFGIGCRATAELSEPVNSVQTGLQFANAERLREHWLKHGSEFGAGTTEAQYLAKAQAFFTDISPAKLLKHRPNGDELHYLPNANEFGVLSDERVIRTFFRPNTGRSYWDRQ